MTRQEAVELEAPKMVQVIERLLKRQVIGIFIFSDGHGISVVGNCTPEGLTHYLEIALEQTSGGDPDHTWTPDSSGH